MSVSVGMGGGAVSCEFRVLDCCRCVFLPWMIIPPVGNTRGCCATSWHSALSSSMFHLLPSVILILFPSSYPPSILHSLWDWRCALTTQRDSVQSEWEEAGRSHCLIVTFIMYWSGAGRRGPDNVCINISMDGKREWTEEAPFGPLSSFSVINMPGPGWAAEYGQKIWQPVQPTCLWNLSVLMCTDYKPTDLEGELISSGTNAGGS